MADRWIIDDHIPFFVIPFKVANGTYVPGSRCQLSLRVLDLLWNQLMLAQPGIAGTPSCVRMSAVLCFPLFTAQQQGAVNSKVIP